MLEEVRRAVSGTVGPGRIGVAFSGGVDSSLLAKVCGGMGYGVTLLTVGLPGSHDIGAARTVNCWMRYPHLVHEIDPATLPEAAGAAGRAAPGGGPSWIENGVAFYYVSLLARRAGLRTVVTANGIDELFCGYDAYRREYGMGEAHLRGMIDERVRNELAMMAALAQVARGLGVGLVQPLLSEEFVGYARGVPIAEKIAGPGDMHRKHPVRRLAREAGVPEAACSCRKKALQYGSGIHRELARIRRRSGRACTRGGSSPGLRRGASPA